MQGTTIRYRPSRSHWAALLLAGSVSLTASAAPTARHGVFVYSDLCVNPDNGEGGGQRISLLRFAEVDTVLYEFTAGSLSWPVLATDVNIDPPMGALYFTVQTADGEQRTISGKLSRDRQSMTLAGGYCANAAVPIKLARVTDFSRRLTACTPCPATAAP
jgi:hypothetical protein